MTANPYVLMMCKGRVKEIKALTVRLTLKAFAIATRAAGGNPTSNMYTWLKGSKWWMSVTSL